VISSICLDETRASRNHPAERVEDVGAALETSAVPPAALNGHGNKRTGTASGVKLTE